MKKNLTNIDSLVSPEKLKDIHLLSNLVEKTLNKALEIGYFNDEDHFNTSTSVDISSVIPFPLSLIYSQYQKKSKDLRQFFYKTDNEIDVKVIEKEVIEAYSTLSSVLESSEGSYFLGSFPSSVDALIFGHLTNALSEPMICMLLDNPKRDCTNLIEFWETVKLNYFEKTPKLIRMNKMNYFEEKYGLIKQKKSLKIQKTFSKKSRINLVKQKKKIEEKEEEEEVELSLYPGSKKFIFGGVVLFLSYFFGSVEIVLEE